MQGLMAIFRKELSDHFSSYRFVILFALIAMVSFITSYMAGIHLREGLEGITKPKFVFLMLFTTPGAMFSMVQFVAFFGPLIGLVLGFDTINRERAHGTLIKLLMVITGFGLMLLGVVPGIEEIWRLIIYVIISIFYISFWLGVAILFSIFFRSIATSALASVALWIFLSFFVSLAASVLADTFIPVDQKSGASQADLIRNARLKEDISMVSPMVLYSNASKTIIDPMRKTTSNIILMGPMEQLSASRFQNPLSLGQSIYVIYPHLLALIAITLICFVISYTVFMLQEIRT